MAKRKLRTIDPQNPNYCLLCGRKVDGKHTAFCYMCLQRHKLDGSPCPTCDGAIHDSF